MKRIALTAVILVLAGLVSIALRPDRVDAAPAAVSITPASKNFGNVSVGSTSAVQTFTLKNFQDVGLSLSISISSEFTQTNSCGSSLAPKTNCTIDVRFVPAATGVRTGTLTVTHNASGSPTTASLTGTGTAPVTVAPTSLSFGSQAIGITSAAKTVSLTNNQSTTLTGISSSISGDFARTSGCSTTLAPGASCAISVTFTPTVAGTRTGTLTIANSAAPQTVPLSGTGATPGLTSIVVTPVNPSVPLGVPQQFVATGNYTNGTTQDLTSTVTWTSSAASIATISNTAGTRGLATALARGTTTVTAAAGAVSGSTTLTVTAPTLVSIAVTPQTASIALGTTRQFVATGTYTDGSTQNLSSSVTWSSTASSVASINSSGLATGSRIGSTIISATSGSISGTATLDVTAAALTSISVSPANPTVAKGLTQAFTATGSFTDGTTQDLTLSSVWSSSATAVATINSGGVATAVSTGNTTVRATVGSVVGQTTLTVGPAALVTLAVTPATASIPLGTSQQYKATGTYTDGSTQDLTASAIWASSQNGIATINAAGLAASAGTGATTISATSGAKVGSTTLTVTPAALVSIAVTPAIPSIPVGTTRQFTATGTFTDATIQDITNSVTWSSSQLSVATISMTPGTRGLATAVAVGTTTIGATAGSVSGTTTLTVTPAVIVSISVAGVPLAGMPKGTSQQLTATATYSNGSNVDITSAATWASSNPTIVTVTSGGLASAAAVGSVNVTAAKDGVTGYAAVTVTPAVLTSIQVAPALASIALGTTQQFGATGVYTDGSTQIVTAAAHWSSSNGGVATVSNAPATAGLANSVAVGSVTVTATIGSISGTASLTVTPAALASIVVTPASASIPLGTNQQFAATGHYTDSTTQDITTSVTWSTSLATVAIVSNTVGSNGLATSSGIGTTTITAKSGTITGSATLTVGAAAVVSIAVTPSTATVSVGQTKGFIATATYTDGTSGDVTNAVTWASSSNAVATIASSGIATGVTTGSVTISATSGSVHGTSSLTVIASPSIASFSASPGSIKQGESSALTAVFSNGTGSIDNGAGAVSSGVAKVVVPSNSTTYTLTVTNAAGGSVTATATVTVVTLQSIGIVPTSATIPVGSQGRLSATGTYSDASTANISNQVVWSSSVPSVATVNSTGLVSGIAAGTTTVTATYGGVSGSASVTVTAVSGAGAARFVYTNNGGAGMLGYLTDQATGALTMVPGGAVYAPYTFASLGLVADPTGHMVYSGSYYGIYAFSGDAVTGQLTYAIPCCYGNEYYYGYGATATNANVNYYGMAMHPSGKYLFAARRNQSQLDVYLVDGGNGGLTWAGTYTTGVGPSSVAVDPAGKFVYIGNLNDRTISAYTINDTTGALTAVSGSPFSTVNSPIALTVDPSGHHVYVASTSGQVGAYTVNSATGALTAVAGAPYAGTCCVDQNSLVIEPTGRFAYMQNYATGTMAGYSIDQVSGALTALSGSPFTSATNAYAAAVDASGRFIYVSGNGSLGALAINQTTGALTTVSGSPFGVGGSAVVTTALGTTSTATLVSLQLSPTPLTITTSQLGVQRQLTLIGTYSDGTTRFLTESATWSASVASVASVSDQPGTKGRASIGAYGTTTVTASYGGQTITGTLTVQQPAISTVTVTPTSPTIASGTAIQLQAVVTYVDSSTQTVTALATWASSNPAAATVSTSSGAQGLTTGIAAGTTTITATYNGVSGTASVTVQ